jgi:4,5-DOPA dioxygenase extradiol
VLRHVFPNADVPVLQLSINARQGFDYHIALGRKLASLRDTGVLIIGTGNIVHNLRAIDGQQPNGGFDWAQRFDDAARTILLERPSELASLQNHADFSRAAPTPEHFMPILYLAGLAADGGGLLRTLIEGCMLGSLSMTSYVLE